MVQVTAQVEGVASDVRFREGDHVEPGDACCCGSTPTATASRPSAPRRSRTRRWPSWAGRRPTCSAANRWPQSQLLVDRGAHPLAGRERPPRGRGRGGEGGPRDRAPEPAAGRGEAADHRRHQHPHRRHRPVRPHRHGARDDRGREPAAAALQGLGGRVAARPRGRPVSFGVAPLGPREFGARIYHVGRVADPTTRQVEVLAWVDPETSSSPASSPRSRSKARRRRTRWWCRRARSRRASAASSPTS